MDKTTTTTSPLTRRRRVVLVVAAIAAIGSVAGVIAATAIRSPAQQAADAAAPPASLLTAQVVRKVLSASLVMRGTFTGGRRYEFTPTAVAPTANGPGGSTLVVTAVKAAVGDPVQLGAVLLEVSERPVFVLPGAFPAYRDMRPGQTGKDIAQLQAGLARVGFRSSDRSGYFGPATQSAVQRFYTARGYAVPLTDPADDGPDEDPAPPAAVPPSNPTPTPTPSSQSTVDRSADATDTTGTVHGAALRLAATTAPAKVAMVPMSEVVFLPDQPARVAAFAARVGDRVAAPLIAFGVDGLTMTARLDPSSAQLVKPGAEVSVLAETSGFSGTGTVHSLGAQTTDAAGGGAYIPLVITPTGTWPQELEGQDARVTITTASTDGEVLAVPVAAISSSADGRATVTVVADDGSRKAVEVTAGVSADGWVEVSAPGDALRPGDRVVTGT